jgi:hypothetical protein
MILELVLRLHQTMSMNIYFNKEVMLIEWNKMNFMSLDLIVKTALSNALKRNFPGLVIVANMICVMFATSLH